MTTAPAHPSARMTSNGASNGAERRLDFHPGIPMRWEITQGTWDTGGRMLEATSWLDAHMPGPPVHLHPKAEESYVVVEGTIDVWVHGEWSKVSPGQKVTVGAGVPHTVRNDSDKPARIVNVHRPAQQFEPFFRDLQELIERGKIKGLPPKDARSAIYAAMLFATYSREIVSVKPPKTLLRVLAFIGRILRYKVDGRG